MSLIKVENLSFTYPNRSEAVFEDLSFQFDTDWKTGLIGRNGCGKTTFLRLLMGEYEYRGRIIASTSFTYFPYPVKNPEEDTISILQSLAPEAQEWEFNREAGLLSLKDEALYQPFSSLSMGERTKALLSALFLKENSYLLIDEPTNALDSEGRKSVAEYLRRKNGFLLVSHDRAFLDRAIDHVIAFSKNDILVVKGNFFSYWRDKSDQEAAAIEKDKRLKKDISRLEESSKRSKSWAAEVEKSKNGTRNSGLRPDKGYIGHKAAKMNQRAKNIERRKEQDIEDKKNLLSNIEETDSLKIKEVKYRGDFLLSLHNVSLSYGEKNLFEPVSLTLQQGDRIALEGENGCGKSTLLKFILGENISYSGEYKIPSNLKISYLPQETSHLQGSLKDYAEESKIDESLFKTILVKLGFDRDLFSMPMEGYSEGQKKKVLIAKSLSEEANLFLWDEPLNFLDVYARSQLEELILSYQPTMIFVEHDEMFRSKVATDILRLRKL